VALGLGLALIAGGNVFRAAPQGQTRAFLILESDMGLLYAPMEQECPQGFEMTVEETFLSQQTPAERERLLRPENGKELASHWKGEFMRGPGGENICNNPKSFMNDPRHPVFRGTASKVAYGMNLDGTPDGRATANTCGHQKFAGVSGEPGIDNQLYRAVGCSKLARSTMPQTKQVLDPFVIEIRGLGIRKTTITSRWGSTRLKTRHCRGPTARCSPIRRWASPRMPIGGRPFPDASWTVS